MKYLFARECRAVLEQYASSRVLLAFDFDGTLAPVVSHRDAARMRTSTRARLSEVAHHYPCAVISGRSLSDLASRLAGVDLIAISGNHGVEPSADAPRCAAAVKDWIHTLRERLSPVRGIEIEDKHYSVALHYRHSPAKRAAVRAIRAAIQKLGNVRVIGGKAVVNLVPSGAPHKGLALQRLREQIGAEVAVYVGDDVTDEDVFGWDVADCVLSIRIGWARTSGAAYYLRSQREIERLLDQFLASPGGTKRCMPTNP